MSAYKDEERGTWYVKFSYVDWKVRNKIGQPPVARIVKNRLVPIIHGMHL